MPNDPTKRWSVQDALETYGVPYWGKGYFGINPAGRLVVCPEQRPEPAIDLAALVETLAEQDIHPPILFRFTDLLRHRMREMAGAFRRAIEENGYQGGYICVYPVKVNQQRQVVEEIRDCAEELGFGFEAGSKPELLAVLAITGERDLPVVCNGFKDSEFIEMVTLAQKLGRRVLPVVEKASELDLILDRAAHHGVRPELGIRVKLTSRGAGRWELSGGLRSKFGLFVPEVLTALEKLKQAGLADCLKLLHFHLGSQITQIRSVKTAVTELARVYVELKQAGAGLEYIDIGGGLGVDYDGSQTNFPSSMNYTLTEYASDAVYRIMATCDEAEVEHPTIISESGRAMVAHHAALVFEVLGTSSFDRFAPPDELPPGPDGEEQPQPLVDLHERLRDISVKTCMEYFHDALQSYEEAMNSFNLGYLDLEQRALAERYFWAICRKVEKLAQSLRHVPEDLEGLGAYLADIYICNFSIFQSMPDSWAIDHLFPVMPIHRLNERPVRRGILVDVTCDSDGKIDKFTHLREDKHTLELHELNGAPYLLGAFLVGAYQEILGDLHNLFGDTHVVHVSVDEDGRPSIDSLVEGDTVSEVLEYVQFNADELRQRMRETVGRAVESKRLTPAEASLLLQFFHSGLGGYTYLEDAGSGVE